MLKTKFRGNRSTGSGEIFDVFYPYMENGSHLGHVTSINI